MPTPDPDSVSLIRLALASAVIIALLALLALGLKYFSRRILPKTATGRLEVLDSLALDVRRRIVIVRCDETEHLLLLGSERDLVIESGLKAGKTPPLSTKGAQ